MAPRFNVYANLANGLGVTKMNQAPVLKASTNSLLKLAAKVREQHHIKFEPMAIQASA